MSSEDACLFCKIIRREIPGQIVFENEHTLAFRDLRPVAPTHVLVIPKTHVAGVAEAKDEECEVLGRVLLAARTVAAQLGVDETGYRLVMNNGADAGRSVEHLHCHVLGGRPLAWPPG